MIIPIAKPKSTNSHPLTSITYPLFLNNLHAVSKDFGNINKAISYLLPSDSKNKAEQATDAPNAGFHPK